LSAGSESDEPPLAARLPGPFIDLARLICPVVRQRGFRQFLLRGLEAVQAEWALICTAHNITKLAKAI
jgi:hypothetical protein